MSQTIKTLQRKIGVSDDGKFGADTAKAFQDYYVLTHIAAAHLLGQCYHETGGFKKFKENPNYSAQGLAETWPERYALDSKAMYKSPNALAYSLERDPVRIANNCYADRMGNGDEASGDGWKYRGVGAIQLTGRRNITRFAQFVNRPDLVDDPSPIETELAFDAARFFFMENNLFAECTGVSISTVKRVSNGVNRGNVDSPKDPIGLKERQEATFMFFDWLAT